MEYHACNRIQDDIMRIPMDDYAFEDMEDRWPLFKEERRNPKLSLVVDGVNPFGDMRSIYSMWPIFVIK